MTKRGQGVNRRVRLWELYPEVELAEKLEALAARNGALDAKEWTLSILRQVVAHAEAEQAKAKAKNNMVQLVDAAGRILVPDHKPAVTAGPLVAR